MTPNKTLFLASGLLGPNREGNQSINNTILGYLDAGYRVFHFSWVSSVDRAFDFGRLLSRAGYFHFGAPAFLLALLRVFNRRRKKSSQGRELFPAFEKTVDIGETEVTWKQNVVTALYALFETARMGICALAVRPVLVYGYDVAGALAGYLPARFAKARFVTRFQGTYVSVKNRRLPVMRLHVAALTLRSAGVVMNNDGTKGDAVATMLGIKAKRLFFATNGLDQRLTVAKDGVAVGELRQPLNTSGGVRVAGVFTRFYPYKRVDRALRLLKRFRDEGVSLHLFVGGSGPLEGALRELAQALGVAECVTWLGAVPYDKMAEHYLVCDVVLHLNDYANINNQVLESIALGVPLVAIDEGANARLFGAGQRASMAGG
jgi:glycosyltransferase involved in cell wall biosynthesis